MLPEGTLAVLDRIAGRGNRSRVISDAVLHYIQAHGRATIRKRLEAGYRANADENLRIAMQWFPLEDEAWQASGAGRKKSA
jgi:metal-responsive CopG/Arc/MetJ family transcriptional regulator